jgi:hypothetical protein
MRKPLFTTLLLLSVISVEAQVSSSPYSRYGLGDFQFNGFSQNMPMGGGGIGLRCDSTGDQQINILNPASYTGHMLVTYDVGLQSNTTMLSTSSTSGVFNRTTLSHVGLAFPVTKWWGASLGLIPYSSVGYNVSTSGYRDSIGYVTDKYEGSGGISQVFVGNAFRPFAGLPGHFLLSDEYDKLESGHDSCGLYKKLRFRSALANISIGANTSYLFGSLNNIRRNIFADTLNAMNTKITRKTIFRDAYASFGIQYRFHLYKLNPDYQKDQAIRIGETSCANRYRIRRTDADGMQRTYDKPIRVRSGTDISIGAIFAPPMDVTVNSDLLGQTYKLSGSYEVIGDTIYNNADQFGTLRLPTMVGVGFAVIKGNKFTWQGDFAMQRWEGFTFFGTPAGLRNSMRATTGIQWQPKAVDPRFFFRGMTYRFGLRYNQTYLELNNQALNEYALGLGLSLPLFKGNPLAHGERLNLGFDIGHRGTTDKNLISENFVRFMVSVTINDRWFTKVKFD